MHKRLHTILSIGYIFIFLFSWTLAPSQLSSLLTISAPIASAQEDLICPANSHQVGDQCICDSYYKSVGDSCVPMSESEMCPTSNSHRVGNECVCDSYYRPEGGQCVPMSESEMCPISNTHRVGDECVCNEGYLAIGGKCTDPDAYCAAHHANYSASIQDCSCIIGYEENASKTDCIPVAAKPTATTTTPPTSSTTAVTNSPQGETPSQDLGTFSLTPIDPVKMILELKSESSTGINNTPILDASIKDLTPSEISIIEDQKEIIQSALFTNNTVELQPTEEEKMNLVRTAIVLDATKKWDQERSQAEKNEKVKNESDRQIFDSLKQREASLNEMIKNNQGALEVMHKQNVQFMLNEQSFSSSLWLSDKQFQDTPKRDFMKESNGDATMAMVLATQAISSQYQLIRGIKDELRKVKEDKLKLLDIPPKPDMEKEFSKIKIDWYKK